jgi:hypothetical protein
VTTTDTIGVDAAWRISTTYDGHGGYSETWADSYYGYHGGNDYSADGSYTNYLVNPDGSYIEKSYSASTGVTYSSFDDGHGGYLLNWTNSDGSSGEDNKYDDGSYTNTENEHDGTIITNTYDASTGVTEDDEKKTDGSYIYTTYNADGSGITNNYDASTKETLTQTFDSSENVTYEESVKNNTNGTTETIIYDVSTGSETDTITDSQGGEIVIQLRDKFIPTRRFRDNSQSRLGLDNLPQQSCCIIRSAYSD